MTRGTVVALVLLLLALLGVGVGAWELVRRDGERLVRDFASERLHAVEEAAREVSQDLRDVVVPLRVASRLHDGASGQRDPAMDALVGAVGVFRLVRVYDRGGAIARSRIGPLDRRGDPPAQGVRDPPRFGLAGAFCGQLGRHAGGKELH